MTPDMADVIRYISDRIGHYEKPESLSRWAEKALKDVPSCRYALLGRKSSSISLQLRKELRQVEALEGFSLMEKLQLAFIFSRSVSDEFVQMLRDAQFEIEQDKEKRISRFSTADGRIVRFSDHKHYDKYFEGVYCQTGKRKGYREVRGIEEEAGAAGYPGIERKLRSRQQEDVRQEAFNGPIDYDELDEQEWINPRFPKRVKMEYESSSQAPTTQAQISVISLVTHIETIAMYFDLSNLQNKASLAIKIMEDSGENKTLSVKKFNSLIDALLICIEENRIRRSDTSIPLKSILKHLQLYLIRPLRSEEAMESISQKIQEIGGNNDDGVPPNLISESLAHLLMAIGFYNQLES
ncbi:hypothetical protein B9Z55_021185 [Caenorhabditis nigoni]|uniref:SPK domain-containing protein n=1 Tax=Caenorhabditis nigoni TaxID=1611254 RepID=A0A2G5TQW8_9PELO|nr:hypothetical protein B9Z55_021185 [Caenorhabditis nigoni]